MSILLDIPESRIEKFGIGKAIPTSEELNKIKSCFDISIDWLLYNETPDFRQQNEPSSSLNDDEIQVLKKIVKDYKNY
jgi:hypothetical protein